MHRGHSLKEAPPPNGHLGAVHVGANLTTVIKMRLKWSLWSNDTDHRQEAEKPGGKNCVFPPEGAPVPKLQR